MADITLDTKSIIVGGVLALVVFTVPDVRAALINIPHLLSRAETKPEDPSKDPMKEVFRRLNAAHIAWEDSKACRQNIADTRDFLMSQNLPDLMKLLPDCIKSTDQ